MSTTYTAHFTGGYSTFFQSESDRHAIQTARLMPRAQLGSCSLWRRESTLEGPSVPGGPVRRITRDLLVTSDIFAPQGAPVDYYDEPADPRDAAEPHSVLDLEQGVGL